MKTIVTIPAYNEEGSIGAVVKDLRTKGYSVLVVDDGSTDNTAKEASDNGAIVYKHKRNFGLAKTFQTEIKKCLELGADVIIHTDADGQYDSKDIAKMIQEIEKGADLVLASRFAGTIESMPWLKKLGNRCFTKVVRSISKLPITDAQTGFRAFTREVAEQVKVTSGYTYTQEQIIKSSQMNFKIVEIPTYFFKRDGESRLMKNPFDYAFRAGINVIRIYRDFSPLKFFGQLSLLFFIPGLYFGLRLLVTYLNYGTILNKIPRAILCALFILVGVQVLLFGLLADKK